jgi:hypothetical protein
MIRAALALTTGFVLGTLVDMPPLRAVRRWYTRVKLRLVLAEIRDVCDDIADAIHDRDMLLAEGLTDFYTDLCNERDALRVKLSNLS